MLPCCLFCSSITMGFEQTKVLLFPNKHPTLPIRPLIFFWVSKDKSSFFFFLPSILWTQKHIPYCIIRLEETLSRNNNRNAHICTVLSREKYFIVLLTKVQSEKKNIRKLKELQRLYSFCLNCWRLCSSSASNIGHQRLHNHLPYMVDISAFQHSKANKETLIARSLNRLKVSH